MATIALSGAPTTDQTPSERMPLGAWLRTTPGLIRLLSIVAVAGLVAVAVTGVGTLIQRRDATGSAATISGPQLVTAGDLYASLAATDAIAASTLLRRGSTSDPAALGEQYEDELARADGLLFDLTEGAELSPTARDAAGAIATELSIYAGRVACRRGTNGEYGSPVSAAYMRAASDQMRERILPEATTIWSDAATRLHADYGAGTSVAGPVAFAVAAVVALVALLLLATFLALRTRRLLNLGVLAAVVVLGAAVAGSFVLMAHEHDSLARAQRDGSDPLLTLSAAQFLALQGQADLNLALAERDTREAYLHEFDVLTARVAGSDGAPGLLDAARTMTGPTDPGDVAATDQAFDAYVDVAGDARTPDETMGNEEATTVAESAEQLAGAAATVNRQLALSNDTFERRFTAAAADSRTGSDVVVVVLAVGLALAGASVLIGVQPRIGEYR